MKRTPAMIVEQTLTLARDLYALQGYTVTQGYRFDRATHPQERLAWRMACLAQETLTDTDPEDAVIELAFEERGDESDA